MPDHLKEAKSYQRELFETLDDYFLRITGKSAPDFSSIDGFPDAIRQTTRETATLAVSAYRELYDNLRRLYSTKGMDAFRAAKQIAGLKLVQGGTRFTEAHLNSLKSSILYADTILIPDPVYPWIESERREERFRDVLLLQNAHALLHLKPLVDAELPNLPVLVFPSFEKSLEERDLHTQQGIRQLTSDILARYVDPGIEDYSQAAEFALTNPERFIQAVEQFNLVVAPGGAIGNSVAESLSLYEKDIRLWRSPEWAADFLKLPAATKLLYLLTERIAPQLHVLENSEEMSANPLIAIEQQAHYFKIVSDTNSERLAKLGLLDLLPVDAPVFG